MTFDVEAEISVKNVFAEISAKDGVMAIGQQPCNSQVLIKI